MPAPTVAELKEHVETDLPTAALQRLIDDADQDVVSRYGADATQTDDLDGGSEFLFPTRRISSITSITESSGNTDTVIAVSDYRLMNGGRMLQRRTGGVNSASRWYPRVTLVYVPVDDAYRRKRVVIDLVHLAIKYNALSSEHAGDHIAQSVKYQEERESVLRALAPGHRWYA